MKEQLGNCEKVACDNLLKNQKWFFCFGYIQSWEETSSGLNYKERIHCWNEDEEFCYDYSQGKNLKMKKQDFYNLFRIRIYVKQDINQIRGLLKIKKQYGWWFKDYEDKIKENN